MDYTHTDVLIDYEVFYARFRLIYRDDLFPPDKSYVGASSYQQQQTAKRVGLHDLILIRDSMLTAWDLPEQALEITGVELISLSQRAVTPGARRLLFREKEQIKETFEQSFNEDNSNINLNTKNNDAHE